MNTISTLMPNYGSVMMRRDNVSIRAFAVKPNPQFLRYWTIQFGPDDKGVINAAGLGDMRPVPYKNLWIVYFDGKKVWVPIKLIKKT